MSGKSLRGSPATSFYNPMEASVVLRLLLLLGTDPTVESIAIITPYKAQVCTHA